MPGNSMGIYGGFSSHIVVPAADLCMIEQREGFELPELAVIADAVTTPYQACKRGDVKEGDNIIVIGVGGVGSYTVQMAKAFGAKTVIAIDIDQEKLNRALEFGADFAINSTGKDAKAIKNEFKGYCKEKGLPHNYGWKVFEASGSAPGQEIALSLLSFIGKMVIIGFNMQKVQYSISKLMAYDAEMIGTWGCLPQYYPDVLKLVLDGKIQIKPFLETRNMSTIRESFEEAHSGKLLKRIVLVPDF
jgi:6-hydroxycyclohex-1-ene-1-carbonyl-CoA dehydrogenase